MITPAFFPVFHQRHDDGETKQATTAREESVFPGKNPSGVAVSHTALVRIQPANPMMRPVLVVSLSCLSLSVVALPAEELGADAAPFIQAAANGRLVREGHARCQRYVDGWLKARDQQGPVATQLLPERISGKRSNLWSPRNAAADNYAFMVLTSSFTHPEQYHGILRDILAAERKHASLPDGMPTPYRLDTDERITDVDLVFEASEYVKDGLLPIAEWLGTGTPWFERMLEIQSVMWQNHAKETSALGQPMVSHDIEVNGEQLQVLSRLHWLTGDPKWLDYASRIGEHYLLGEGKHPADAATLRFRDHGNEIMGGLTEWMAALGTADPAKAARLKPSLHRLYDRALAIGRNDDGFFYNVVNPKSGETIDARLADNFGYVLNGYYTLYLLDKSKTAYREAVLKMLENIEPKYSGHDFGERMDGRADAAEGVLNLINREPNPAAAKWVDDTMRDLWKLQREDGVIEGWHGDGNFARTTLMYGLWKSQGLTFAPYHEHLELGAVQEDGILYVSIHSGASHRGKLRFDHARHRNVFKLPVDWPRINQFPEWFTVEAAANYQIRDVATGTVTTVAGQSLIDGWPVSIGAGEVKRLAIRKQ